MGKTKKLSFALLMMVVVIAVSGCTIRIGSPGPAEGPSAGGVWKSTDAGITWHQAITVPTATGQPGSIASVDVRRMYFDPQDSKTIYLATENHGLVYTNDGANTWRQANELSGMIRAIAIDPVNKCTLYATQANKVFKSDDCGRFWKNIYFHQNPKVVITDVKIDYFDNSIIYISTSSGEVIKSNNYGVTWITIKRLDRGYIIELLIDPTDSRIVYASTLNNWIYKTTNAGQSWQSLEDSLRPYNGAKEFKRLIADPATSGGLIHISKYGILRSIDYGVSWEPVELLPGEGDTTIFAAAVDPTDSRVLYYTTRTALLKSIDGGSSWSSRQLPFNLTTNRILINPDDPTIIYMGIYDLNN